MRIALSPRLLARNRRLLVLRGAGVLVLALAALPFPILSLEMLMIIVSTIALVAGLLDAALFGAVHRAGAAAWVLLAEAFLGVTLGGALLIYPMVPLEAVGGLLVMWVIARGAMLVSVARVVAAHRLLAVLSSGWALASLITAVGVASAWSEATIVSLAYLLVAYALIWGALELVVARELRRRWPHVRPVAPTVEVRSVGAPREAGLPVGR